MILVDLFRDPLGRTHFEAHESGTPRTRVALCGLPTAALTKAAWFPPLDPRGQVHYERACDPCRQALAV